jgi:hypothetical protein
MQRPAELVDLTGSSSSDEDYAVTAVEAPRSSHNASHTTELSALPRRPTAPPPATSAAAMCSGPSTSRGGQHVAAGPSQRPVSAGTQLHAVRHATSQARATQPAYTHREARPTTADVLQSSRLVSLPAELLQLVLAATGPAVPPQPLPHRTPAAAGGAPACRVLVGGRLPRPLCNASGEKKKKASHRAARLAPGPSHSAPATSAQITHVAAASAQAAASGVAAGAARGPPARAQAAQHGAAVPVLSEADAAHAARACRALCDAVCACEELWRGLFELHFGVELNDGADVPAREGAAGRGGSGGEADARVRADEFARAGGGGGGLAVGLARQVGGNAPPSSVPATSSPQGFRSSKSRSIMQIIMQIKIHSSKSRSSTGHRRGAPSCELSSCLAFRATEKPDAAAQHGSSRPACAGPRQPARASSSRACARKRRRRRHARARARAPPHHAAAATDVGRAVRLWQEWRRRRRRRRRRRLWRQRRASGLGAASSAWRR